MATIYRRVGGRKLTKIIALHADVQAELDAVAMERAARASAILKSHRDTGDSFIHVLKGKIDHYVTLDDMRGQKAALSIEYGRRIGDLRTVPVGALHGACPEAFAGRE